MDVLKSGARTVVVLYEPRVKQSSGFVPIARLRALVPAAELLLSVSQKVGDTKRQGRPNL